MARGGTELEMYVVRLRQQRPNAITGATVALFFMTLSGCKQPAVQVPPTPVPVAKLTKPTITYFEVEPTTISEGQTSFLRWSVENAHDLKITPDVGTVQASDRRQISPAKTTTYELTATNAAGSVVASVTVAVSSPLHQSKERLNRRHV